MLPDSIVSLRTLSVAGIARNLRNKVSPEDEIAATHQSGALAGSATFEETRELAVVTLEVEYRRFERGLTGSSVGFFVG